MIVADASWVVALRDPGDDHHRKAVAINGAVANEDALLHPVTLAECLVAPAHLGVLESASEGLRASFVVAEVDHDAPLRWAALRAETGLRLPDAIVLDTALSHNARAIATFDARLAASAAQHGLEVLGSGHTLARQAGLVSDGGTESAGLREVCHEIDLP